MDHRIDSEENAAKVVSLVLFKYSTLATSCGTLSVAFQGSHGLAVRLVPYLHANRRVMIDDDRSDLSWATFAGAWRNAEDSKPMAMVPSFILT